MKKNISFLCFLWALLLSTTIQAQPIVKTHIETGDIEGVITLPNADKIHFVDRMYKTIREQTEAKRKHSSFTIED